MLVAPGAATAQMTYYPPVGIWPGAMLPDAEVDDEPVMSTLSERSLGKSVTSPADSTKLVYAPSPARTRANIAAYAARSRAVDPQGAAAMEALFASTDVRATVETGMRGVALTTMHAFTRRDLAPNPSIRANLARVGERPAYVGAMVPAEPGMASMLRASDMKSG